MSQSLREQIRDRLNFHPEEDLPCPQVLGIGLTEDICMNDESLHRWLVCKSIQLVEEEGMEMEPAIARAFDLADEQCEFFDLELPEQRRTDFGPLQAQRDRQQRLGGGAAESGPETQRTQRQPQRAEREPGQRPMPGTEPEQRTLGGDEPAPGRRPRREDEPERAETSRQEQLGEDVARLSEFEAGGNGEPEGETAPDRVAGESFLINRGARSIELPNSVGTWERVPAAPTQRQPGMRGVVEWRSNNVNGYDAVWIDGQGSSHRAFVATAGANDATPGARDLVAGPDSFNVVAQAAVNYMEGHRDGRPIETLDLDDLIDIYGGQRLWDAFAGRLPRERELAPPVQDHLNRIAEQIGDDALRDRTIGGGQGNR